MGPQLEWQPSLHTSSYAVWSSCPSFHVRQAWTLLFYEGLPPPLLQPLPGLSHSLCARESTQKCCNQSVHTLNVLLTLASLLLVA